MSCPFLMMLYPDHCDLETVQISNIFDIPFQTLHRWLINMR